MNQLSIVRAALFLSLLSTAFFVSSPVSGQVSDLYRLRINDGVVGLGGDLELRVTLDIAAAEVQGWAFGVCHDPSKLTYLGVENGTTVDTVRSGQPAEFNQINTHNAGWTSGVILCFTGCAPLLPGLGYELYVGRYLEAAGVEGRTDVSFCDNLGLPPIETMVVIAGNSITPETYSGTVEVIEKPPYLYRVGAGSGEYSPLDGTGEASVDLYVAEQEPVAGGLDSEALSMGVAHDSKLLTPISIELLGELRDMNGGMGPDFFGPAIHANGVTFGSVYSFLAEETINFSSEKAVARVHYETIPWAFIENDLGTVTTVEHSNALGSPPVRNLVVHHGTSQLAEFAPGTIELIPVLGTFFLRGDCNGDTGSNVADGIWLLNYLYLSGPSIECLAACDTDGNGTIGMLDGILLIQHWLIGGPPPVAPYPECGVEEDAICPTYPGCSD